MTQPKPVCFANPTTLFESWPSIRGHKIPPRADVYQTIGIPVLQKPGMLAGGAVFTDSRHYSLWKFLNGSYSQIPFEIFDAANIQPAIDFCVQKIQQQTYAYMNSLSLAIQNHSLDWKVVEAGYASIANAINKLSSVIETFGQVNSNDWEAISKNNAETFVNLDVGLNGNDTLYKALQAMVKTRSLSPKQKQVAESLLRNAELLGAGLPEEKKRKFIEYKTRLARYETESQINVANAKQAFRFDIFSADELEGLSDDFKLKLAQNYNPTQANAQNGPWRIYYRDLKNYYIQGTNSQAQERVMDAALQIAPENDELYMELLKTGADIARLFGEENYADYILKYNMMKNPRNVQRWLDPLFQKACKSTRDYYGQVAQFATESGSTLTKANIGHYSTEYKKNHYNIDLQAIESRLEYSKCLETLFQKISDLFGVSVTCLENQVPGAPEGVARYSIAKDGQVLGVFYLDVWNRSGKTNASFTQLVASAYDQNGSRQMPICYVSLNLGTKPQDGEAGNISLTDLDSLSHEFGHVLQSIFFQGDDYIMSTVAGMEGDAQEFASEFAELYFPQLILSDIFSDEAGKKLVQAYQQMQVDGRVYLARNLALAKFDQAIFSKNPPSQAEDVEAIFKRYYEMYKGFCNESYRVMTHPFYQGYSSLYYKYVLAEAFANELALKSQQMQSDGANAQEIGEFLMKGLYAPGAYADGKSLYRWASGRYRIRSRAIEKRYSI